MKAQVSFLRCKRGSLHHYYHFLFGAAIPLHAFLRRNKSVDKVVMANCGTMHRHLLAIPSIARTDPSNDWDSEYRTRYIPAQDWPWKYRLKEISPFSTEVLAVTSQLPPFDVLIVDRRYPDDEWKKVSTGHTTGAQRRRISNIPELVMAVGSKFSVRYVDLANLGILEQAALFHTAKTIIAQHGAGLSNLVFCRKGAQVIEIGAGGRRHYSSLSSCLGLDYLRYNQDGRRNVITVKPEGVIECIK